MCLWAAEGLPCGEQDIHQHTQRPPVNTVVVATAQHCSAAAGACTEDIVCVDREFIGFSC
jgi:hypothetical protein